MILANNNRVERIVEKGEGIVQILDTKNEVLAKSSLMGLYPLLVVAQFSRPNSFMNS